MSAGYARPPGEQAGDLQIAHKMDIQHTREYNKQMTAGSVWGVPHVAEWLLTGTDPTRQSALDGAFAFADAVDCQVELILASNGTGASRDAEALRRLEDGVGRGAWVTRIDRARQGVCARHPISSSLPLPRTLLPLGVGVR